MTTSNEIQDVSRETSETEKRTLDQLLNLEYNEMTDEEIERVVEYRAEIKARDAQYAAQLEELNQIGSNLYEQAKSANEQAQAAQEQLLNLSLERLKKALK